MLRSLDAARDRARGGDEEAARVRRRRLPRAAHAADQHPRQPRAAAGLPARARPRRRAGDDRLGAALLAADDAGWSATCCCSPAPTPARRGAPPPLRPRRGRRQRRGRGGAADGRPRAAGRERARRSGSQGNPRRAAPDGPQPARQRRPPHAADRDRRAAPARRGRRRPWSRSPTTAPGSPPSCATQIFDRFVRGDGPADTATGSGSGLGLAIVRAVAASHGGTAEAGRVGAAAAPCSGSGPAAQQAGPRTSPLL